MNKKINIVVIPADNRPVSYTYPELVGSLNRKINIIMPPREVMGGLNNTADPEKIIKWLSAIVSGNNVDFIICALDSIAYGGLIQSRKNNETLESIISRLTRFKDVIKPLKTKVYAFSSILRISNSYDNQEEKFYWKDFGKLIFEYSFLINKNKLLTEEYEQTERLNELKKLIPQDIISDFLKTRQRNFCINEFYLELSEDKTFDFLVYGKDDTAEFGINIQEAQALNEKIKSKNLSERAVLHTGADEIITMLIARAVVKIFSAEVSVFPIFSTPSGGEIIPLYEDKPITESLKKHFKICGVKQAETENASDLVILLHTPEKKQNDIALLNFFEKENEEAVNFCGKKIKNTDKPVIIADIRNANGSDNLLCEKLFAEKIDFNKIYGYAGWNTAGNTIGSALSTGICAFIAEKHGCLSKELLNRLIFIRFADDWAYQSKVRQIIRATTEEADEVILNKELITYTDRIAPFFSICPDNIIVSFPWGRTFEVEINVI